MNEPLIMQIAFCSLFLETHNLDHIILSLTQELFSAIFSTRSEFLLSSNFTSSLFFLYNKYSLFMRISFITFIRRMVTKLLIFLQLIEFYRYSIFPYFCSLPNFFTTFWSAVQILSIQTK